MINREYSDWSTEKLIEYEQRLYDAHINDGDNNWFERDKVLWELSYRKEPVRGEHLVFPINAPPIQK